MITNMNYLQEGLTRLNFSKENFPTLESDLETYIKELSLFNSAYDLVGAENNDEIIVRHILDSLSAYKEINELKKEIESSPNYHDNTPVVIADIGSGGGLPGIPLSLTMRDINFKLIERMSKRCAFLENCGAILKIKKLTVENLEAERVEPNSIDIAVFRAFRPLDKKMIKTLLRLVKPNGYLAAYKAKEDKIHEEMSLIKEIVPEYSVKPLCVPFLTDNNEHERNLVIIQKQ